MARRIVVETDCGHKGPTGEDIWRPHVDFTDKGLPDCPGGSRRVLDPGSYLLVEKVDGEWPEWALRAAEPFKVFTASDGYPAIAAREGSEILDALAGGEQ